MKRDINIKKYVLKNSTFVHLASIVRSELSVLHNYILKISINQAEYTNFGHLRRKFRPFSTLFQKKQFLFKQFMNRITFYL